MNKVKTLKLNIITSVIPWGILAIIGFVKIKFFISTYGSELNGFTQLVAQIYGYLSLVEMGFGAAIVFKLYKPFANGDQEAIAKLFNGCKKIYKSIGIKLFLMAIITSVVLPFIVKMQNVAKPELTIIFLIYGIDYLVKYILDLPYRSLLYADQKKYKANIILNIFTIVVKLVEMILILLGINFYVLLIIVVILNILSYIIFNTYVKKQYKWLNITKEVDLTTKEMTKDIMGHKISRIVFYGTDNIVASLSQNIGLIGASIYSSYNYIVSAIRTILDMLFATSPLEILGNKFVNEEDNHQIERIYNEFLSGAYLVGIIISSVFFVAMTKLVEIWISKEYVVDTITMIAFSLYIWYECVGRVTLTMIEARGNYKETKNVEILSAIFNIVFSFILAKYLGIAGLMIATVLTLALIRQPFQVNFLYKKVFKSSMTKSWLKFFIYTLTMLVMCLGNYLAIKYFGLYQNLNYLTWAITTIGITIVDSIIVLMPALLLDKPLRNIIKRLLKRNKNEK